MNLMSFVAPLMHREIYHLYGPFAIYSYGFAIAIGLIGFISLIQRDPQFKYLNLETTFPSTLLFGIVSGIFGGKILYLLTEPTSNMHAVNIQTGFSILGCMIAILCFVPAYLRYKNISILPFFDLIAVYTPIIHAISRLGCFAAGCCYGMPTSRPWGVIYTDTLSAAPLDCSIHPTQLYSAGLYSMLFIILYFFLRTRIIWPGGLLGCYLIGAGFERFLVDFVRADRTYFRYTSLFSVHQILALGLIAVGCIILISHKNSTSS